MDIKAEINSNIIIVGDLNTSMGRSFRQKNNEIIVLNPTLDKFTEHFIQNL